MAQVEDVPEIGDFFVCRDFVRKEYVFFPPPTGSTLEPLKVSVEALDAASTDFDLTGTIVWSVSLLVSQYLAFGVRDEVRDCEAILEVGAGCGLCGLTAAALGSRYVVCTDNEPEVMTVLKKSVALASCAHAHELNWGEESSYSALEASTGRKTWPLILGADVVYWSHAVPQLFHAVSRLLAPGGLFILGFTNRRNGLKEATQEAALAAGLVFECVDPCPFLPVPTPEVFLAQLPKVTLYRMRHRG